MTFWTVWKICCIGNIYARRIWLFFQELIHIRNASHSTVYKCKVNHLLVPKESIKGISRRSRLVLAPLRSLCFESLSNHLSKGPFRRPKIITKVCPFFICHHISRTFAAIIMGTAFVKITHPANMQIGMAERTFIRTGNFFKRNFFFTFPANHS